MPTTSAPAKLPLREVREARGLTLRQVAALADIDPGALSRLERGERGIGLPALHRLGRVLGLRELTQLLEPFDCDGDD